MAYGSLQPYGSGLYKGTPEVDATSIAVCYTVDGQTICDGPNFRCNKINSITGRMLRYAYNPNQGQGWCEYENGIAMVWPEVKPLDVVLANNQVVKLAIDESNGQIYEIQTRNGPVGSAVLRTWLDKDGESYAGTEIPTEIRLREHVAPEEHETLQHSEGHFYFRPHDEEDKGATGYGLTGYRDAQQIDISSFKNGEISDQSAITKDIPMTGDIVYDKREESERLQTKIYTHASSYKLVKTNQYYIIKDKRGSLEERLMSEDGWQQDIDDPILWISRNEDMRFDRVSQVVCGGSVFGTLAGPDGYADSAMSFSPTTGLTHAVADLTDDFAIIFSLSGVSGSIDVLSFPTGNMQIQIVRSGSVYLLGLRDATGLYSTELAWTGGSWGTFMVERSGENVRFSEAGARLNQMMLTSLGTYGGTVGIMAGEVGNLFDLRIYDHAVAENAFAYYYYNLMNQNGDAVCPIF